MGRVWYIEFKLENALLEIISTHTHTSWEVVLTRRLITSWYLSRAEAESVLLGHKAKGVKHDGRCLQTMQLHQFCKQITNSYYMVMYIPEQ